MTDKQCRCFLPTEPPTGVKWWRPDIDDEPGWSVKAVVRWGEDPKLRRAVRTERGWVEKGCMVAYYEQLTPTMPWNQVGRCWDDTPHPVVACEPRPLWARESP